MKRFVEGEDRLQAALLPHCLDDYVTEDNPVRVIEAFIDELDLAILGFESVVPETTGRPAYHPATLLKIYLLRLSQSGSVEPTTGTGDAAQCRGDVADGPAVARLQDDCGFPQGQWPCDPCNLQTVCNAVPPARTIF